MTVTINSDFTTFTIESTLLSSFSGVTSMVLNIEGTEYVIESGDVYDTDKYDVIGSYEDGIYSFLLTKTTSTTVTKEKSCFFVDQEVGCEVLDSVKDSYNLQIQMDYFILKSASQCVDCNAMKSVYSRLNRSLDDNCGCHW